MGGHGVWPDDRCVHLREYGHCGTLGERSTLDLQALWHSFLLVRANAAGQLRAYLDGGHGVWPDDRCVHLREYGHCGTLGETAFQDIVGGTFLLALAGFLLSEFGDHGHGCPG